MYILKQINTDENLFISKSSTWYMHYLTKNVASAKSYATLKPAQTMLNDCNNNKEGLKFKIVKVEYNLKDI